MSNETLFEFGGYTHCKDAVISVQTVPERVKTNWFHSSDVKWRVGCHIGGQYFSEVFTSLEEAESVIEEIEDIISGY